MTSAAKPMMNTVAQPVSIRNKKSYIRTLSEYFSHTFQITSEEYKYIFSI